MFCFMDIVTFLSCGQDDTLVRSCFSSYRKILFLLHEVKVFVVKAFKAYNMKYRLLYSVVGFSRPFNGTTTASTMGLTFYLDATEP